MVAEKQQNILGYDVSRYANIKNFPPLDTNWTHALYLRSIDMEQFGSEVPQYAYTFTPRPARQKEEEGTSIKSMFPHIASSFHYFGKFLEKKEEQFQFSLNYDYSETDVTLSCSSPSISISSSFSLLKVLFLGKMYELASKSACSSSKKSHFKRSLEPYFSPFSTEIKVVSHNMKLQKSIYSGIISIPGLKGSEEVNDFISSHKFPSPKRRFSLDWN